MSSGDDLETTRLNRASRRDRPVDLGTRGSPAFLGQVVSTGINGTKFFLAAPVAAGGVEAEGTAGIFTGAGRTVPVLWLGGTLNAGEYHVCRFDNFRWVAGPAKNRPGGADTQPTPNCWCTTTPKTVKLTITQSTLCPTNLQPASMTYEGIGDGELSGGYWRAYNVPYTDPTDGSFHKLMYTFSCTKDLSLYPWILRIDENIGPKPGSNGNDVLIPHGGTRFNIWYCSPFMVISSYNPMSTAATCWDKGGGKYVVTGS